MKSNIEIKYGFEIMDFYDHDQIDSELVYLINFYEGQRAVGLNRSYSVIRTFPESVAEEIVEYCRGRGWIANEGVIRNDYDRPTQHTAELINSVWLKKPSRHSQEFTISAKVGNGHVSTVTTARV